MPALAQRAGTKNLLINYDFGKKTREEPAPCVRIHMMSINMMYQMIYDIKDVQCLAFAPSVGRQKC